MTDKTFSKGDTVFSLTGEKAEYVMPYQEQHLVVPHYREDDDFDSTAWPGDPVVWDEVFAKPPVPVVHEEVAEALVELSGLQTRLTGLGRQVAEREEQLRELKRGDSDRLARLKEHRQLARIDDWLAGNITHLVVWTHYGRRVEIVAWADFMKGDGRRDSVPLLVLNGTLEWVDDYARMGIDWVIAKKDSSTTQRVILCNSEAEARERATEAIEKLTAARMRERQSHRATGYDHELEDLVKSMEKIGMPVPADVAEGYALSRRDAADTGLSYARKQLTEAAQKMREAEEQARAAGVATAADHPA